MDHGQLKDKPLAAARRCREQQIITAGYGGKPDGLHLAQLASRGGGEGTPLMWDFIELRGSGEPPAAR